MGVEPIETTEIIPTTEPENSVPESSPTESNSKKEKPENTENDARENLPTTSKTEEENPVEIEKEEPEINENNTPEVLPTESKTKIVIPEIDENGEPEKPLTDVEIEKEKADFIEDGGIEIEQSLTEPEKEIEPAAPPAPPKIEDEEMLTNPDAEPVYEPEQIGIAPQQTATGIPKHGDRKDGMIYINGFGWVADEGGGGEGQYDGGMYENGNKIGYFG